MELGARLDMVILKRIFAPSKGPKWAQQCEKSTTNNYTKKILPFSWVGGGGEVTFHLLNGLHINLQSPKLNFQFYGFNQNEKHP